MLGVGRNRVAGIQHPSLRLHPWCEDDKLLAAVFPCLCIQRLRRSHQRELSRRKVSGLVLCPRCVHVHSQCPSPGLAVGMSGEFCSSASTSPGQL